MAAYAAAFALSSIAWMIADELFTKAFSASCTVPISMPRLWNSSLLSTIHCFFSLSEVRFFHSVCRRCRDARFSPSS